ncbi:DsbA family protein [Patescibacteria group bacterium]
MPAKKSKKANGINPWMIVTFAVILVFAGLIAYDKSPTIHNGVNGVFGIDDGKFPIIPEIKVDVFTDKSIENPPVDIAEQLEEIETEFDLVVKINEIDVSTEDGLKSAKDFGLKTVPVIAFNDDVKETGFYDEAKDFLEKENGKYLLRLTPFKYLQLPSKDTGHSKGPANAPVTIIEYSSFSCPYCGKMKEPIYQLLEKYPNQIQYIYKQYNRGGIDPVLENAAECAAEQDKFWPFHDYIMDNQGTLAQVEPDEFLTNAANAAELDLTAFDTCADEMRYSDAVKEQTAEGFEFGVNGTPSFFINDQYIGGAVSYDTLEETVESFLN